MLIHFILFFKATDSVSKSCGFNLSPLINSMCFAKNLVADRGANIGKANFQIFNKKAPSILHKFLFVLLRQYTLLQTSLVLIFCK